MSNLLTRAKKPLYDEKTGIHRAKTWEMALFALNNTATNLYLMIFMFVSYFLTGIVGTTVAFVGIISTVMRVWDSVTDPILGFVLDKTNGKWGKNRPFIVIGNVILFTSCFLIFKVTPILPTAARIPFYIVTYLIYVVGFTCQGIVTRSAQTCLTNDPEQRPTFAIFDTIYGTIAMAATPVAVTNFLVPKNGGAAAFSNPNFFFDLFLLCGGISALFSVCAVIGLWRKDRTEFFGVGLEKAKVTFKDYWEVLKENRAIRMLVIGSSACGLAQSIQYNSVVYVMLFGIICGNYSQYGIVSAMVTVPVMVLGLLLIRGVASTMGQKLGNIFASWGGIITAVLMLALFLFGNPETLDASFVNGATFFTLAFVLLYILLQVFTNVASNLAIPMSADCADYEVYRSGKYVPGLIGTLLSFVQKLISSFAGLFVSLVLIIIGYTETQPQIDTPNSPSIFWATMVCFVGFSIVGWIINLICMKLYPLSKDKMAEIQAQIAKIKEENMSKQ